MSVDAEVEFHEYQLSLLRPCRDTRRCVLKLSVNPSPRYLQPHDSRYKCSIRSGRISGLVSAHFSAARSDPIDPIALGGADTFG